jgi:crossover junction endodeoxyribonuclease RusA
MTPMMPIVIAISRENLLTSNQRLHWAKKAKATKAIRDAAIVMTKYTKVRPMQRATLEVVVTWPDKRRRDAENIQPSAKAAIDGCVDAGLLPDDSDNHLLKVSYSNASRTLRSVGVACYLTLTFTEVAS